MSHHLDRSRAFVGGTIWVLTLAPTVALGDTDGSFHGPGTMWGGGWGGWFLGPVLMLLFFAAVIVLIIVLSRWLSSQGPNASAGAAREKPDALDILRERFARGEIDAGEFEERKRLLES